ncbi:unnamed protein product [Nippostrongylus brasiliensis]|uniref:Uncharacterized protein n=1 Tax=Nippostrongylus brasiliensis TaxID=27835 RepID=A0A158R1U9_NIPBR|nr:unnamed protein product [Nippostrongylus brasiliensis]
MLHSQLLFFSAVLLTSDFAEARAPQKFLSTVNTTKSFEELVEIAHWFSALAYLQLDGVQGSPARALALADNSVEEVLRNPKKIIQGLMKTLEAEVRALVKLNQSCRNPKTVANRFMKSIYDKARGYLELAVLYLIEAIVKSGTDESKKPRIFELRKDFINKDFSNTSNVTDHICTLGEKVVRVMNAS